MLRRISEFIAGSAWLAILALALSLYPLDQALADHDLKEAWTRYQETCEKLKNAELKLTSLNELIDRKFSEYHSLGCMSYESPREMLENKACAKRYEKLDYLRTERKYHQNWTKSMEIFCAERGAAYQTALTEMLTDTLTALALTGSPPMPGATSQQGTKRPQGSSSTTRRRRKPPVKPTRRTQRGHTKAQSDAAAIITGIIIQGVGQAIRSGSRGGSRGGGGGGGSGGRGAAIP